MNKKPFVAAAVQVPPFLPMNKAKTVELICSILSEAADKGARLIVFPECFLPTYPNWNIDFQKTREFDFHMRELTYNAICIPGPETEKIGKVAREKGVHVVIGVNETEEVFDCILYNSLVFIGPSGEVIGRHRKLFPSNREKIFHSSGDGSGLKVYDTSIGRLGGLICYEHLQPLLKYSLISQGEQIHTASWPGWPKFPNGGRSNKHVIETASRAYALEGQCFVIASCMYIPDSAAERANITNAYWGFMGGSCIINPAGEYVTEPLYDQEGIVYGEIDLGEIPLRKAAIDVTGRDSAFSTISMNIDRSSYSPIRWKNEKVNGNNEFIEKIKQLEKKIAGLEKRIGDAP